LQRNICIAIVGAMANAKHDDEGILLDLGALKALGHPLRAQILDALSAYGPATASMLAERFDDSSGALSYHLRQLEKHGLVREDTGRGVGRERWWMRVPQPIALDASAFAPNSAERVASRIVIGEWQRNRFDRLQRFINDGMSALEPEWIQHSVISTTNRQLTAEQLQELSELLSATLDAFLDKYRDQNVPGMRPVQVHIDVFPLVDGAVTGPADVGGGGEDDKR